MPRPPLPLGTAGEITVKPTASGKFDARCRFRDFDGTTRQFRKTGATAAAARNALKEAIRDHTRTSGQSEQLTRDSTLAVLADLWLKTIENEGGRTQQTITLYTSNVRKHVLPALGGLRIQEATTGRLESYFMALKSPSTAKVSRVVLTGMFALAARHDVTSVNPVRDTTRKRVKTTKPRAMDLAEIRILREAIVAYQNVVHYGPKRGTDALEIIDVMIGTGARPGEVFALRWCDVDLDESAPTLTVTGTVVRLKGQGLIRQEHGKTSSSHRTIPLIPSVVAALRKQAERNLPSEDGYVFPSAAGTVREPNNFARILRDARPAELEWISPYTFRRTAATLIERMFGADAAAAVLGHSDTAVTRRHYIMRAPVAPDVAAAFAGIG